MNRIYRLVFNRALGVCQAVSEVAAGSHGSAGGAAGARAVRRPALSAVASACVMLVGLASTGAWAIDGPVNVSEGSYELDAGQVIVTPAGAEPPWWEWTNAGSGAAALTLSGSATGFINRGTATGGAGGYGGDGFYAVGKPGGEGGAGVRSDAEGATVTNGGTLAGGAGGAGGYFPGYTRGSGGTGGVGADFASAGTLNNTGRIAGGAGGIGDGRFGNGGAGVRVNAGGLIVNSGEIVGGSGDTGGYGVVGADLTVVNGGVISGGKGDFAQAAAVFFTGGTNVLEMHGGSAIYGDVIAAGSNDTLVFGGSQDGTFNLNAFNNKSIQGFEHYEKAGSGTWTMLGYAWNTPTGQVREGTLRLGDGVQSAYLEAAYGASGAMLNDAAGNVIGQNGGDGSTALHVNGGTLIVESDAEVFGGNGGYAGRSVAYIVNGPSTVTGGAGGHGGSGVALTSGFLENSGRIRGGDGSEGGSAGLDNKMVSLPLGISSSARVAAAFSLVGGAGGNGGHGVASASAEPLVNNNRIEGGRGGSGGYASADGHEVDALAQGGQGGEGGHGVILTAAGAQFTNNANGFVRGGDGGQGGSNDVQAPLNAQSTAIANGGTAGAGVVFANVGTLINTGRIEGGQGGSTGSTGARVYNYNDNYYSQAPSGDASATATGVTTAQSGGSGASFGGVASVTNAGTITGGMGAGSGGFAPVALLASGGGSTAYIGFNDSASTYSGTLSAVATGSAGGQGGAAVLLTQGGQIANTGKGWIEGGEGGGGASAWATISIDGYVPSFGPAAMAAVPAATGTASATGGNGGRGGDGIVTTGGSITNEGTIRGGRGGSGGSAYAYFERYGFSSGDLYQEGEQIGGKGGTGGIAVVAASTTIFNAQGASITGGDGGQSGGSFAIQNRGLAPSAAADSNAGAGNVGISGSDLTIVNAGRIAGGYSGDGQTQAAAVAFTGGVNTLSLHATSDVAGQVTAFSAADTLALGGKADGRFDVAAIGPDAQYRGFGVFRKIDESTWTLGGATAAVTPWTIDQGTLSIASDASLGDVSGALTIGAGMLKTTADITTARKVVLTAPTSTVSTDAGTTLALDGTVSGNGTLVKDGAGTLRMSASNVYTGGTTIAAGTLVGGASSFGTGAIVNNGALVIDQATNATLANDLSGTGSLTKTGAATVFYTGNGSAYTGNWQVAAGTLSVTGSLGGTVAVDAGSTLKGNGSIGNTFLANGATVAPGNSIGTLTVNGDLTFAPGAFYQVETNAQGQSDRIDVTGTATLGGASVVVIAADGNWAPTTRYTILTSSNRLGTFGGVSSNFAFLDPSITYEANNVLLTLNRNTVAFPTVGQTFNQRVTGAALEALGGGALYNAVVQLDAPTARSAFDQLSGELHASVGSSLMEDSRFVREAGIDRLRQSQGGAADLKTVEGVDGGAWARVYGAWGEMDGDGNAARVDRDSSGVLVGADRRVGNWRVGVMGGVGRSEVDVDARRSSARIDNYHLGIYGGTEWGALALRTGASYSRHAIDTSRSMAFTGVVGRTESSYDAHTTQVFGELGWRLDAGKVALEPFANLAHANLKTDGFSESGGITALSGRSQSTQTTFTTLGLRASTRLGAEATGATLRGLVGWRHAFGDVSQNAALAFAGGNAFAVAGVPIAKNAAVIEAGVDFSLQRNLTLGVSYAGQVGDGVKDHGVKASLLWKF